VRTTITRGATAEKARPGKGRTCVSIGKWLSHLQIAYRPRGTLNLREWTMRELTNRYHVAGMEFVGVDKSARCGKGGHCSSGQCGTMWQGWTVREWTKQEWSNACEKCAQESRQAESHRLYVRSTHGCWTNDREIGVPVLLAAGGHVATVGQLLFAPWAWVYSTLHPFGVGK